MITKHRGYTIDCIRRQSPAGVFFIHWRITRDKDELLCDAGIAQEIPTLQICASHLKKKVDEQLKLDDPWGEKKHDASQQR